MLNTALYAINFGDFYYENLDCFANYSKLGLKEIVLVHVIDPALFQHSLYSVYKKEDEEKIRRFAEIKLEDIKKDLEKSGFGVRIAIRVGNIADEIADEAEKEDIDFVVLDKKVGIKSKGFLSFYGSPLYDILIKVDKPVLIMKRVLFHASGIIKNDEKMNCKNLFADVVFATDFSEFSLRALPFINKVPADIIKMFTILYVIDEKAVKNLKPEEIKNYEKNLAEKAEDAVRGLNYRFTKEKSNLEVIVRKGVPCKEITDFMIGTRKKLLILGHKGKDKEKLAEILFGSTAERVVNALPCSILIVK
ncbi:MAG: universal stress protein [Deltaproteobacteria bacterium]|nr:universal stress protein [Deltaproteobacteria bacterium]MCL5891699.1 universal stress protein [Deltaproteobacteria bacterium]